MRLILPLPPSSNRYWRNYRGVTMISDEARAYKTEVWATAKQAGVEVLEGDVIVSIDLYRARKAGDLDNRIKVTLDALNGIAWRDDKQVAEIHARRFDDKANPRLEVLVEKLVAG